MLAPLHALTHVAVLSEDDHVVDPSLQIRLSYTELDPYAVSVEFPAQDLTWTFARDLLEDGLLLPVGEGDVRVAPYHDRVCLTLCPGQPHEARFLFEPETLRSFLAASFARVPHGVETSWMEFDHELADLLA